MTAQSKLKDHLEHTLLTPWVTEQDIALLCREAVKYELKAVCVPPYYTVMACKLLSEESPKVVTVIGFPMGYQAVNIKAQEAKKAVQDGADELDMVMNLAAFKSRRYQKVAGDIQSISTICHQQDRLLKVIIETSLLNEDELRKACEICVEAEVDFVKTSTGYQGGASLEAVQLLRSSLPKTIGVKASGGIKDREWAETLVNAGATRIGTSSALKILDI